MATVFRPPVVSPTRRRDALAVGFVCASAIALLTVVVPKPFAQTSWPVPDQPKRSTVDLRIQLDPTEHWLLKDTLFGAPGQVLDYDWPLPPQPKRAAGDLRFFSDPTEYWLLKDQLFGAAGQTQSYDYPNPRSKRASVPDSGSGSLLVTTLTVVQATAPMGQAVWTVPERAPISPITSRTQVFYYAQDDTAPFSGYVAEVPQARPALLALRSWSDFRKPYYTEPVGPAPWYQTEWPNPQLGKSASDLRIAQPAPLVLLTTIPPTPTVQSDWPIPRGKDTLRTLFRHSDQRRLYLVDLTPAALREWPIPSGKPYPVVLRTFSTGEWASLRSTLSIVIASADVIVQATAGDYVILIPADDPVERT